MAVSQVVALRGPGWLGSSSACRPAGVGFRTTCSLPGLAVAWLKRGVSATKVLELGVPATVLARRKRRSVSMAAVMIGVDPHKASHTAVAFSVVEEPLGELRVRACAVQAERLLAWAAAWPQRTWAVEGAGGLGHLLAQQLLSAGERRSSPRAPLRASGGWRLRPRPAGRARRGQPVPRSRSSPSAREGWPRARRPRVVPGRGRTPRRDRLGGRTPGRWPGPGRRGRSGGCGPGRWGAGGSDCSGRVNSGPPRLEVLGVPRTRGPGYRAASLRCRGTVHDVTARPGPAYGRAGTRLVQLPLGRA